MNHCSTAQQRSDWISQLLVPEPTHGLVSQLSRAHQVSRQTLYRWKVKGAQARHSALDISHIPVKKTTQVQEQVLTLLIEAHASYRDIQTVPAQAVWHAHQLGKHCRYRAGSGAACSKVVEPATSQHTKGLGLG